MTTNALLLTSAEHDATFVAKAILGSNTEISFVPHCENTIYAGQIIGQTREFFLQRLSLPPGLPEHVVAHRAATLLNSETALAVGLYCVIQSNQHTVHITFDSPVNHPECPPHLWNTHRFIVNHLEQRLHIEGANVIVPIGKDLSYAGRVIDITPHRYLQNLDHNLSTSQPLIVVHDRRNISRSLLIDERSTILYQNGHPTAYLEPDPALPTPSDFLQLTHPDNLIDGRYSGIIVEETDTHYLQLTSNKDFVQQAQVIPPDTLFAHSKPLDSPHIVLRLGEAVTFQYDKGVYTTAAAKLPIGTAHHVARLALSNPHAQVYEPDTEAGFYCGPLVAETEDHYIQQVSIEFAVMHRKRQFSPPEAERLVADRTFCSIRYQQGITSLEALKPQRVVSNAPRLRRTGSP